MSIESTHAAEPPEPSEPPELVAATDGALELAGRTASVSLDDARELRGRSSTRPRRTTRGGC